MAKKEALDGKPLDLSPFLEENKMMDKEIGYSEFYKDTTPYDPDFEKKFKNLAKKVDQYNKNMDIRILLMLSK